jgi:glycerophosphoryl diester phosphodiesterase
MGLGIELDVHLSKDGQIVVFHDDNLKRMTGTNEYIKFLTYEQIQQYNLAETEHKIPLLKQKDCRSKNEY